MDQIKTIIEKQLHTELTPLESLQVQNHIYGCVILMEEITEQKIILDNMKFTQKQYTFDIDNQFDEIGFRYGFLMDTKLLFDSYLPEYKTAWLNLFNEIGQKTLEESDQIEDALITIIKNTVPSDLSFFLIASQTGSLPQEWLNKVIQLLTGKTSIVKPIAEESSNSVLAKAAIEKQIKRFRTTKRQLTQGTHSIMIKKPLAKTRRAIKFHGLKM
jgi:hypothetical protein